LKNYKQHAPSKAPLISSMLKNMKLSWSQLASHIHSGLVDR
jgi:hypothetical protein